MLFPKPCWGRLDLSDKRERAEVQHQHIRRSLLLLPDAKNGQRRELESGGRHGTCYKKVVVVQEELIELKGLSG